jgi:hypothetical protein
MKNIINQESQIKNIISKSGLETPSEDFTSSVMQMISLSPLKSKYQSEPVFTKKFWYAVAVAVVTMCSALALILTLIPLDTKSEPGKLDIVMSTVEKFAHQISASESLYIIPVILLSMLILMIFDNSIKKKFFTK